MSEAAVQLKVAGKTYQVVTSAAPDELHRLAAKVEEALLCVTTPGREVSAQNLILAAITLAHELEEERALRTAAEKRQREILKGAIAKVEGVLASEVFGELASQPLRRRASRSKASELPVEAAEVGEVVESAEVAAVMIKSSRRSNKSRSV